MAPTMALATFLAALMAGALPFWFRPSAEQQLLRWMTGLAAGFLIASALVVALPEGYELVLSHPHGDHASEMLSPATLAGLAVLLGFLTMMGLETLGLGHDVHEEHHDQADHVHHHPASGGGSLALILVVGLSFHAITDGLAIGTAAATGKLSLSLPLLLGVTMHKMPAAFSLAAFSLHERESRGRAMIDLLIFSSATPLALLTCSWLLVDVEAMWLGLMVLFSAGTFIYVATVDVLPNVHHSGTRRQALLQVLVGAAVIVVLKLLSGLMGGHSAFH